MTDNKSGPRIDPWGTGALFGDESDDCHGSMEYKRD